MDNMAEEFEGVEIEETGEGVHERYLKILEKEREILK